MAEQELAFFWLGRMTLLSVLLQTLEIWTLRSLLSEGGYWDWKILRQELSPQKNLWFGFGDFLYSAKVFQGWLGMRGAFCFLGFLFPTSSWIFLFLLITNLAISFRWRGSFNGGSDAMTLHSLLCLWLWYLHPDGLQWQKYIGGYFIFQVVLSYWVAGYVKLKNPDWWNGKITQVGLLGGYYSVPSWPRYFAKNIFLMKVVSFGVLIFEIFFPLAFLNKNYCLFLLILGFLFHLSNALILGLNRFFWSWIATYPAIYFLA